MYFSTILKIFLNFFYFFRMLSYQTISKGSGELLISPEPFDIYMKKLFNNAVPHRVEHGFLPVSHMQFVHDLFHTVFDRALGNAK